MQSLYFCWVQEKNVKISELKTVLTHSQAEKNSKTEKSSLTKPREQWLIFSMIIKDYQIIKNEKVAFSLKDLYLLKKEFFD